MRVFDAMVSPSGGGCPTIVAPAGGAIYESSSSTDEWPWDGCGGAARARRQSGKKRCFGVPKKRFPYTLER
jgi:hypothetical protein